MSSCVGRLRGEGTFAAGVDESVPGETRRGEGVPRRTSAPCRSLTLPEAPPQGLQESPGFFQKDFAPNNAPLKVTSFLQVFIPQITD